MKKFLKTKEGIGILSLVISALLGAIMGVWVRMMSASLDNFQQIAARAIVGSLLGLALYSFSRKIKVSKFFTISKPDFFYILVRTTSLLIGIGLFTYAINTANFSNINMIYALPTTALLGIFILKEKLTLIKLVALVLGFLGVVLITVKNFSTLSIVGMGEIAALVSTIFYSISYIARKFMSKAMNNEEIAVIGSLTLGVMALLTSIVIGNKIENFLVLDWSALVVVLTAGLTFIFIGIFNNYGFEHTEAIVANNLLTLSPLFGLAIGILLYKEAPTIMGLIGGLMVIFSAVMVNYSEKNVVLTEDVKD